MSAWDTMGGRELDRLAEGLHGTSRRAGETDVQFRHRLTFGTFITVPDVGFVFLPPPVRAAMDTAKRVVETAWEGGYFDRVMDTTLTKAGNLERMAEAGRKLLEGSGAEVRVVTRNNGTAIEIWPDWNAWEVRLRADVGRQATGGEAGPLAGDPEVVQP